MDRWTGKVAIVAGASDGIGAAIGVDLVRSGVIVIGLARRPEWIEELRNKVPAHLASALHALRCDVTKEEDILAAFAWVERTLGGVDILVYNVGILKPFNLTDKDNTDLVRSVLDSNVIGLVQCTREAYQSMKARSVDGHVVLINSIAGHKVPHYPIFGSLNIYAPSKYAVTAITEVLRQEFNNLQTKIKITSVSPGAVLTELVPDEYKDKMPFLDSHDVSASVLYALGTPPHVQVHEITIKTIGELQ